MGYRCPVCTDPQSDGEHLANHLAFTAMLGDDDHETWLAETVPEWEQLDPPALADRVVDHADEADFPQVFEDTTDDGTARGGTRGHDHDHGHLHGRDAPGGQPVGNEGTLDEETRAALERARAMTRRHRGDDTASDDATEDTASEDAPEDVATDDAPDEQGAIRDAGDAGTGASNHDADGGAASGDETE